MNIDFIITRKEEKTMVEIKYFVDALESMGKAMQELREELGKYTEWYMDAVRGKNLLENEIETLKKELAAVRRDNND